VAAAADARRGAARDRAHRTAWRFGRSQPAAAGRTQRRQLCDQRREDLDLGRRPGRRGGRLRPHRQCRVGCARCHRALRSRRYAGADEQPLRLPRPAGDRARLAVLRERASAAGPPPRRREQGLRPGDAGLRLLPRADRAAGAGGGARRARRDLGPCRAAQGLRPAAGGLPGAVAHARSARHAGRGGAAAVPAGTVVEGPRPAAQRRGGDVQVVGARAGLRDRAPMPADARPWRLRPRPDGAAPARCARLPDR